MNDEVKFHPENKLVTVPLPPGMHPLPMLDLGSLGSVSKVSFTAQIDDLEDHPLRDLYGTARTVVLPEAQTMVFDIEIKESQVETFELLTGVCYKCFGKNGDRDTVAPARGWRRLLWWRNSRLSNAACKRCNGTRRAPARQAAGQA